jgi:cyclopropane-fatty-acyl-phospholipid synthase
MLLLDRMMRRFVRTGCLTIIDAHGRSHRYAGAPGPTVTIALTDPALHRSLFFNPELKAGEAYMNGTLRVEEGSIRDFLLLFARNREHLRGQGSQRAVRRFYKEARRWFARNTLVRARQNVAHHYDLSNDLYRLFLDADLNYSCAYFRTPDDSIETAQQNKLRHIAAKLDVRPGQRVLDIGCGWGGMALYLASHADVEVLGVTLSTAQLELARQRARERSLDDRVKFELIDYRHVTGSFDRIVSIGMFEHVGVRHYLEYFTAIRGLLAADGVALVHSIGRMASPGATMPWLDKYIFPGAYAPALSETLAEIERSRLYVTDIEILRRHYAETLLAWDRRFQANRARVQAMFDERFCRMWEFYLIAAEMGFRYGRQMVFQIQLARHLDTLPITRDYMLAAEAALDPVGGN